MIDVVLETVRRHLSRQSIRLPRVAEWTLRGDELHARLPGRALGKNIQTLGPSVPWYALAACYWFEVAGGERLNAVIEIDGPVPDGPHARRARFMLTELSRALGDRIRLDGVAPWHIPDGAVMNAPLGPRAASSDVGTAEHQVEVLLTELANTPMGPLQRQFPVGLFDGVKSRDTRLFPGNGAQADLWSFDAASRTLHLVELKVQGNATVGILPEAFTYARLLQRFAEHPTAAWSEEWEGARAARTAERTVMWLLAEELHPLVFGLERSPLTWLNERLGDDGLEFRVVRFERTGPDGVRFTDPWPG